MFGMSKRERRLRRDLESLRDEVMELRRELRYNTGLVDRDHPFFQQHVPLKDVVQLLLDEQGLRVGYVPDHPTLEPKQVDADAPEGR